MTNLSLRHVTTTKINVICKCNFPTDLKKLRWPIHLRIRENYDCQNKMSSQFALYIWPCHFESLCMEIFKQSGKVNRPHVQLSISTLFLKKENRVRTKRSPTQTPPQTSCSMISKNPQFFHKPQSFNFNFLLLSKVQLPTICLFNCNAEGPH